MSVLELEGNIESLKILEEYVLQELERLKLPADLILDIRLVAEEIFANIVFHAYPNVEGCVHVKGFVVVDQLFCIEFRDWGSPFNPLEQDPPDLDVDLSERDIGGLGIYLVKELAHEVRYAREDDSNVLTVCFRY